MTGDTIRASHSQTLPHLAPREDDLTQDFQAPRGFTAARTTSGHAGFVPNDRQPSARSIAVTEHEKSSNSSEQSESDVTQLVELSRLLVSMAYRSLKGAGGQLALTTFRAMAVLRVTGPCSANGLAAQLDMHSSSVTRLCDKLLAAGWITREQSPQDRRECELALTHSGRRLVDRILAARAAEVSHLLARLATADRAALAQALPSLLEAAHLTLATDTPTWIV